MPTRDLAVIFHRSESNQSAAQLHERLNPLAEYNRFATTRDALFQVRFNPIVLAAHASRRIKVADLLQPQHELENVLNGKLRFHLSKPHDAFFLSEAIRLGLLWRKFNLSVAEQLGRQVGQNFVLGAAQHIISDSSSGRAWLHFRLNSAR